MFNRVTKINDFCKAVNIVKACEISFAFGIAVRHCSKHNHLNELLLTMPKEKPHTAILKSQRIKGRAKNIKYTPGTVTLQVLGSGAKGAPRSLYVFTDHSR